MINFMVNIISPPGAKGFAKFLIFTQTKRVKPNND